MRQSIFAFSALLGSLAALSIAPVHAGDEDAVTIDGFTVQKLAFPTIARAPKPQFKAGNVKFGTNLPGAADPYSGTPLEGSPYFSLSENAVVVYLLKRPATSVLFIWGTPDAWNNVTFYDANRKSLGTLNGGDMQAVFGLTNNYYRFTASAPIAAAIATSSQCCFEITNQKLGPAP